MKNSVTHPRRHPPTDRRLADKIAGMQAVIRRLHGVEATHTESVSVPPEFLAGKAWDGVVELFTLRGHHKARRCYSWGYIDEHEQTQYVVVLRLPPATDPGRAVKAYNSAEGKAGSAVRKATPAADGEARTVGGRRSPSAARK
jgi:hypothetical protein